VHCTITPAGLRLLAQLDGPIEEVNREAVRTLGAAERRSMVRLLAEMRGET
jgi:hypothetical protein